MPPEQATTAVCAECGARLPPSSHVCPGCGGATTAVTAQPPPPQTVPLTGFRSLVDRPWLILCLLFFVTAICGLPLLWISRGFSLTWKIVLSLIVTLYTVLLFWGFWWIVNWSWTRILDSLR